MARLKKDSVFVALSGSMGQELLFMRRGNSVVVGKYPDMNRVKTKEMQKQQSNKMKEVTDYAQLVLRNPELQAMYEAYLKKGSW